MAKDLVFFFKEVWKAELPETLHDLNDYVQRSFQNMYDHNCAVNILWTLTYYAMPQPAVTPQDRFPTWSFERPFFTSQLERFGIHREFAKA